MNDVPKIDIDSIQRISFDKFEKDFFFIVNGEIYNTNSFVATLLSPNISKMFEESMNISYYEINTEYSGDFNQIIEYGEMKEVKIRHEEMQYFLDILKQFGNNYTLHHFYKELQNNISYENVVQRIKTKKELNINFGDEISFISRNFHDFYSNYPEMLFTLDVDIMEQIISNEMLNLNDEEELFDIILNLYTISKEYSLLFSYVIFMNLSTKSIRKFNENFDINDINNSIWEKIRYRLEQDISNESRETYEKMHQNIFNHRYIIKKNYVKRYEHIIQHLTEQYHGNVHLQNVVHITASSIYSESYKAENIVEQNNNIFGTKSEPNSWIQFDFKEKKVLLDHYTLKTMNWNVNSGHLKSWILEVSNDGKNYIEIDRHENCDLLNGCLKTATFKVSCSTPQQFVRLTQIGPSWCFLNCLFLNQIEFSGFLYE